MKLTSLNDQKTRFTRQCISEAILSFLEENEERLKVSAIAAKAGVSRITFYKYYRDPYDALKDYLGIILSEYIEESGKEQSAGTYYSYEHILYSIRFFDRYSRYFLTLAQHNLHYIILEGINNYMVSQSQMNHPSSLYEIYCYAGGLFNTFLKWEENGKKESPEELAKLIYHLYHAGFEFDNQDGQQ